MACVLEYARFSVHTLKGRLLREVVTHVDTTINGIGWDQHDNTTREQTYQQKEKEEEKKMRC